MRRESAVIVLGLFLIVALLLVPGCTKPYAVAWRTLDAVQRARDLTAQQLAAAAAAKHRSCLKAHGGKTASFAACIDKHREALDHWRQIVRPAINSAVQITATAVQIAERARDDPKIDWLLLIKPAVCALSRWLRMWGHYLGDKAAAVLGVLQTMEGVACHD